MCTALVVVPWLSLENRVPYSSKLFIKFFFQFVEKAIWPTGLTIWSFIYTKHAPSLFLWPKTYFSINSNKQGIGIEKFSSLD